MKEQEKALLDSRIRTINVAIVNIQEDVKNKCLPCVEHHQKVISDTLYDIYLDLEEELEGDKETVH
jgi:hypothetical protein